MKPQEILAAAAVLDIAKAARATAFDKQPQGTDAEEFLAQNPITDFVPAALKILREVNLLISNETDQ